MCRSQWDFSSPIRLGYRPVEGIKNLDFGNAIHRGLESYYHPETWNDKELRELAAIGAFLIENERQLHQARTLVPQGSELEEGLEADFNDRKDLGLGMLNHYFLWAPKHDRFTPLHVEVEFSVPIPGIEGAVYEGKLDVIVEDEDGAYWIIDHKTAAQLADMPYLGPVELDPQVRSYCWAIRKQLGIPIRGFIINEIRKSFPSPPDVLKRGGLSKNKQQDTTLELYLVALEERGMSTEGYEDFLDHLRNQVPEHVRRTSVFITGGELHITEQLVLKEALDMLQDPFIYPNPSRSLCQGCLYRQPCIERWTGGDYEFLLNDKARYKKEADERRLDSTNV